MAAPMHDTETVHGVGRSGCNSYENSPASERNTSYSEWDATRMRGCDGTMYLHVVKQRVFCSVLVTCLVVMVTVFHLSTTGASSFFPQSPFAQFGGGRRYVYPQGGNVTSTSSSSSTFYSIVGNAMNVTTAMTSTCRASKLYNAYVLRRNGTVVYPEDLLSIKPFNYLPNFKNPCFVKPGTKTLACFPYYFLVGAPKSGTTDLSRRITRHPQVSSNVMKEPHWLTRRRFQSVGLQTKFYPTLSKGYMHVFTRAARDIVASGNRSLHTKVVGDCSASTLWDNSFWPLMRENENRSEPVHTNADFIHHLNPRAKIIAILRNPIDRLYSDYLYFNRQRKTPEQFHASVVKAMAYFTDCFQRCSYRHCVYTLGFLDVLKQVRLQVGLYYYSVADYMKVFPRDQVLVIKMEDYSANMPQYMRQVFSFLELDPLDEERMAFVTDTHHIFNTRRNSTLHVGAMLPETRKMLHRFYKPHNEKLEILLGTKLWEDEPVA